MSTVVTPRSVCSWLLRSRVESQSHALKPALIHRLSASRNSRARAAGAAGAAGAIGEQLIN